MLKIWKLKNVGLASEAMFDLGGQMSFSEKHTLYWSGHTAEKQVNICWKVYVLWQLYTLILASKVKGQIEEKITKGR